MANLQNIVKYSKSEFVMGDVLGQGSFAVVQKAKFKGVFVALKILQMEMKQDAETELNIMTQLNHRNVLKLNGVIKENFQRKPILVFEFMENGSLESFVRKRQLKNNVLVNLAYDVVCGMNYLHEKRIVHRDLAGRNCLVDVNYRAKVADFGLSRFLDIDENCYYKIYQDKPLPVRWVPKESIPSDYSDDSSFGKHTFASDVWSFGVTMWEIWTRGAIPYRRVPNGTNEVIIKLILEGKNPNTYEEPLCPSKVLGIMNSIFKVDPQERPKFSQLKVQLEALRAEINNTKPERTQLTESQPVQVKVEARPPSIPMKDNRDRDDGSNIYGQQSNDALYISDSHRQRILIRRLKEKGKIKTKAVENLMKSVDRKHFVPGNPYADLPQKIGYNSAISAPQMHATILELIAERLKEGGRALDIGSGSGYLTLCMALMVGQTGLVLGIDHISELVDRSIENIKKSHPDLIQKGILKMKVGDGRQDFEDGGPYDVIHIGAATHSIKIALADQLREGGRLIVPLGPPGLLQELVVLDKIGSTFRRKQIIERVMFAPLTSESEQLMGWNRIPD